MKIKNEFRIGISGGTFDPIHYGHLILAEHIRESFQLDKILFIPSGNPPHKDLEAVTDAEYRYEMAKMATESNPYFEALRIEVDRPGYSYSIDTVRQLKAEYGPKARFFFFIGADVVFDILTWKDIRDLFQICEFIAVMRPGFEKAQFKERISFLEEEYNAVIHLAYIPMLELSSTEIRQRVAEGKSIKYLVPKKVEEYIYGKGLYREQI